MTEGRLDRVRPHLELPDRVIQGFLQEAGVPGVVFGLEERRDAIGEFGRARAEFGQPRRAVLRREVQGIIEKRVESLPSFEVHGRSG